jgi:hypothetical protein
MSITKKKNPQFPDRDCFVVYSSGNIFSDPDAGADVKAQESLALTFTLDRAANSEDIYLSAVEYHPIFAGRDGNYSNTNSYLKYRVVPAAKYINEQSRPAAFTSDEQFSRCKQTFNAIKAIADETNGNPGDDGNPNLKLVPGQISAAQPGSAASQGEDVNV